MFLVRADTRSHRPPGLSVRLLQLDAVHRIVSCPLAAQSTKSSTADVSHVGSSGHLHDPLERIPHGNAMVPSGWRAICGRRQLLVCDLCRDWYWNVSLS